MAFGKTTLAVRKLTGVLVGLSLAMTAMSATALDVVSADA